jgi:hypothetical protein
MCDDVGNRHATVHASGQPRQSPARVYLYNNLIFLTLHMTRNQVAAIVRATQFRDQNIFLEVSLKHIQ